jgi:hypothetical protein
MIPSQRHGILHEDIMGTQALAISLLGTIVTSVTTPTPSHSPIFSTIGIKLKNVCAPLLPHYRKLFRKKNPDQEMPRTP